MQVQGPHTPWHGANLATGVFWVHAQTLLRMALGHVVLAQHVVRLATRLDTRLCVSPNAMRSIPTQAPGATAPGRTHQVCLHVVLLLLEDLATVRDGLLVVALPDVCLRPQQQQHRRQAGSRFLRPINERQGDGVQPMAGTHSCDAQWPTRHHHAATYVDGLCQVQHRILEVAGLDLPPRVLHVAGALVRVWEALLRVLFLGVQPGTHTASTHHHNHHASRSGG